MNALHCVRCAPSGSPLGGSGERFGIDIAGATEGPPFEIDRARRETFEQLLAAARIGDGTLDAAACPYPVHELLTYLVLEHGFLLHGSNDTSLEMLEPRPAIDFETELVAVVACDDGIWPLFYAVVARDRIEGVRVDRLEQRNRGSDPHLLRSWSARGYARR